MCMMRQLILTAALVAALPAPLATAAAMRGVLTIQPTDGEASRSVHRKSVCRFRLDAKGFRRVPALRYEVSRASATSFTSLTGMMPLHDGRGTSSDINVSNGRYRVAWYAPDSSAPIGQDDVTVSCPPGSQSQLDLENLGDLVDLGGLENL